MLKKQYKLILLCVILAVIIGGALSARISYSYANTSVSEHQFQVSVGNASEQSAIEGGLWFRFSDNTATLNIAGNLEDSVTDIHYREAYGGAGKTELLDFDYEEYMNGTLLAEGASPDGSILYTAKSQTVNSQAIDTYAFDQHTFGDASIPLEISYEGSLMQTTDLTVLVYGSLYSGDAEVIFSNGNRKYVTLQDGILQGLSLTDIRNGIQLVIQGGNVTLVGSYIVESYPLFSAGYFRGLRSFFLLICCAAAGVILIITGSRIRNLPRRQPEQQ